MKKLADDEKYKTFVIPDDVGGRYSVLTPVGLVPISATGIDIYELINGAKDMAMKIKGSEIRKNIACIYAI